MDLNTIAEYERIRAALDKSEPVTVTEYDPDIVGAVVSQAELLSLKLPEAAGQKMDGIYVVTGGVALKLSALRYHCANFRRLQDVRTKEIEADAKRIDLLRQGVVVSEKGMIFELEAFFFQLKSTLDMMVKLFVPVLGSKQADISTYGDGGKKVIVHLQQLKKNRKLKLSEGRIDQLIELIQQVRDPWLKPLIAIRDTISHYKSYVGIGFSWNRDTDQIRTPTADVSGIQYPLIEVMERETEHLIDYAVEFVAYTILCAIPIDIYYQPMTEMEKKYIGALWGKDLKRAHFKLSSNVIYDYTERDVEEARRKYEQRIAAMKLTPSPTL